MTPVEYEHVKPKSDQGNSVHHGSIERLFERKHPGLFRHGKVEIVPVSVPEENVLQSGAPSLVSFSKGNLQIFPSYKMEYYRHSTPCMSICRVTCFLGKHFSVHFCSFVSLSKKTHIVRMKMIIGNILYILYILILCN